MIHHRIIPYLTALLSIYPCLHIQTPGLVILNSPENTGEKSVPLEHISGKPKPLKTLTIHLILLQIQDWSSWFRDQKHSCSSTNVTKATPAHLLRLHGLCCIHCSTPKHGGSPQSKQTPQDTGRGFSEIRELSELTHFTQNRENLGYPPVRSQQMGLARMKQLQTALEKLQKQPEKPLVHKISAPFTEVKNIDPQHFRVPSPEWGRCTARLSQISGS